MNAEARLQDAFKEWRRLARAEGEAIRARNWPLVLDCQKALRQLQPQITRCTQEAQDEWKRDSLDHAAGVNGVRSVIADLIEIESRNNSLLEDMRRDAQVQLGQLEQTGRTLRQVQRSYAPSTSSGWVSFS